MRVAGQNLPPQLVVLVSGETALILLSVGTVLVLQARQFHIAALAAAPILGKALVVVAVCQFCLYVGDFYDLRSGGEARAVLVRLLESLGLACLLLAFAGWIWPAQRFGGGLAELAILTMLGTALAWRLATGWFGRSWSRSERVLLVGGAPETGELLARFRGLGPQAVTWIGRVAAAHDCGGDALPWLGTPTELRRIVAEHRPDRVVVGLAERRGQLPVGELLALRAQGLAVEDAGGFFERLSGRVGLEQLRPSELALGTDFSHSWWRRGGQRGCEAPLAALALLAASPLAAALALAIAVAGRGAIVAGEDAIGRNGHRFRLLRFALPRHANGEPERLGRCLRALGLEHLPRLWNVLRGELSLCGPHPDSPAEARAGIEQSPYYDLRQAVRPGCTGWAQVAARLSGAGGEGSRRLAYDLFYVKHQSFGLDLWILLATAKILFLGRGGAAQ